MGNSGRLQGCACTGPGRAGSPNCVNTFLEMDLLFSTDAIAAHLPLSPGVTRSPSHETVTVTVTVNEIATTATVTAIVTISTEDTMTAAGMDLTSRTEWWPRQQ